MEKCSNEAVKLNFLFQPIECWQSCSDFQDDLSFQFPGFIKQPQLSLNWQIKKFSELKIWKLWIMREGNHGYSRLQSTERGGLPFSLFSSLFAPFCNCSDACAVTKAGQVQDQTLLKLLAVIRASSAWWRGATGRVRAFVWSASEQLYGNKRHMLALERLHPLGYWLTRARTGAYRPPAAAAAAGCALIG